MYSEIYQDGTCTKMLDQIVRGEWLNIYSPLYSKGYAPWIHLNNGQRIGVQCTWSVYSVPCNDKGPYTHAEVSLSFSSDIPEGWGEYIINGPRHRFAYVPIEKIREYIFQCGGEKPSRYFDKRFDVEIDDEWVFTPWEFDIELEEA